MYDLCTHLVYPIDNNNWYAIILGPHLTDPSVSMCLPVALNYGLIP